MMGKQMVNRILHDERSLTGRREALKILQNKETQSQGERCLGHLNCTMPGMDGEREHEEVGKRSEKCSLMSLFASKRF